MKIRFRLAWAKGPVTSKHFKFNAYHALFTEYAKRVSYFTSVEGSGIDVAKPEPAKGRRWFCHFSKEARMFTSEELSRALERMQRDSLKEWEIVVGPPDGFTRGQLDAWKPDVLWSFGPLTLPHELASVVAAEQVYRAFTILAGQPYHSGH